MPASLPINDWLTIPASELSFRAVRSGGPGGQNVNKVASKVELTFDFQKSKVLAPETKTRLATLARNRLDREGRLLIASQATRDQSTNLEDARDKLAALVAASLIVPKRRTKTKPSRASKRRRLADKRVQSARKADRRRLDD